MASVLNAMKAKSDQLNYVDIGNSEIIITIEHVEVTNSDQQPVFIYYNGCGKRPYKPSKGMIRVMAGAWGDDSVLWHGKSLKLFGDETVTFGKGEVGGIRIRAMSDIPPNGYTAFIQKNRSTRVKQTIPLLVIEVQYYPDAQFNNDFDHMVNAIKEGNDTAENIGIQCNLSPEQVERLSAAVVNNG